MEQPITPVFTGGTGRSGTTIIVNLLTRHPKFHASLPREIKYLTDRKGLIDFNFRRPLSEERSLKELRNSISARLMPIMGTSKYDLFSTRIHGRWWSEIGKKGNQRGLIQGISKDILEKALKSFESTYKNDPKKAARDFFYSLSRAQISSTEIEYFGDSTPTNIINAKYIFKIFPEAKFINMIRDGRDVALSVSKERWGPNSPEEALDWWKARIEKSFRGLRDIPENNSLTLRLENLVEREREESYQKILNFLNLRESNELRTYFDEKLAPAKMSKGSWVKHVNDPKKFDARYSEILKSLSSKGIEIERYY